MVTPRLESQLAIENNSRVASPGREHCHSPVKGCWLARTHRHSRPASSRVDHPVAVGKGRIFELSDLITPRSGHKIPRLRLAKHSLPKGENSPSEISHSSAGIPEPGTGQSAQQAGPGLEKALPLACGPYGPRGFKSHSRRQKPTSTSFFKHSFHSRKTTKSAPRASSPLPMHC